MEESKYEIHVYGSTQGMIIGDNALGLSCFSQSSPAHYMSYQSVLGMPPLTDPTVIQQRSGLIDAIIAELAQPHVNALVLTGIGGVGKSTLAALLYRSIETRQLHGTGPFSTPPLWLSINTTTTLADIMATLYQALEKPLPDLKSLSPASQASLLFSTLSSAPAKLIVLDQFDNLLHWQTSQALPTHMGIGEWIEALNSQLFQSGCRLLLTSRSYPKGMHEYPPTYVQPYQVPGLDLDESLDLLRLRKVQASETELCEAATACYGHALSLTLLIALVREYGLRLTYLLADPTLWQGDIAAQLLDVIFQHLSDIQHQMLCAFSVYRMPVPIEAVQAFLYEHQMRFILPALRALLTQHLVQVTEEGSYYSHVIVATYARHHFVEKDEQANLQALRNVHSKAAQFYIQDARTYVCSAQECHCYDVLQSLVEAVWHYAQAKEWQKAYELVSQEDLFARLEWHHESLILSKVSQLLLQQDDWKPEPVDVANISHFLGSAYDVLGQKKQAIVYYEKTLKVYQEMQNLDKIGQVSNLLGSVYHGMYNIQEALMYYKQSYAISNEINNLQAQGTILGNIGGCYWLLGDFQEALHYYQQSLSIAQQTKDPLGEGSVLNNIGEMYREQGEPQKALDYYQKALTLIRMQGDRHKEGSIMNNLGAVYDDLGEPQKAFDYYLQALAFIKEVGDLQVEGNILNNLGHIYHYFGKPKKALHHYQQALTICREVGNRHFESTTLIGIASVYRGIGKTKVAIKYYLEALTILHELGDYTKEASTNYKIGSLFFRLSKIQETLHYYKQALTLYQQIGDRTNEGILLNTIGCLYNDTGQVQKALDYYEKALSLCQQTNDLHNECVILNNIGFIYHDLTKTQEALNYLQQAYHLSCKVGNCRTEGITLSNIGEIYEEQGDLLNALVHYQKALDLYRKVEDRSNEGVTLNNIGLIYNILKDIYKALDCYRQALSISRELHDRSSEVRILCNSGLLLLHQESYEAAVAAFILMERIFQYILKPDGEMVHKYSDDLQKTIGEESFIALKTQLEPKAEQVLEQALCEGASSQGG